MSRHRHRPGPWMSGVQLAVPDVTRFATTSALTHSRTVSTLAVKE